MRTGSININGKTYLLCFSARVMRDCVERYGDITGIDKALSEGSDIEKFNESLWLLSKMMEAGEKYARIEGVENPRALTEDELLDSMDIGSMTDMASNIKKTITDGVGREVSTAEAKGKNA